jgi:thiol-disulfide isomerase/thioredoxin
VALAFALAARGFLVVMDLQSAEARDESVVAGCYRPADAEAARMNMKFATVLIGAAVLALGATLGLRAVLAPPEPPPPPPRAEAPARPALGVWQPAATPGAPVALDFADGEGGARSLAEWRGRVVLVNLWATWCAPCVEEMPALDRIAARLGGPDFEVVAIAVDRQGVAIVRPFLEKLGLSRLALYLDPTNAVVRVLGAPGLPVSVVVDREGRELGRVLGAAAWDSPEFEALLRRAIGS